MYRSRLLILVWIQSPPPLLREMRKLLRFIKSLEKEDDSLYSYGLLILVWIQVTPLPREARKLLIFIKSLEKEDNS